MAQPVTLSGPARIRLILALNAAVITPFGPMEWGAYAGAAGEAQLVTFHAHDLDWLRRELRLEYVPASCFVAVLDETGLTLNIGNAWNAYAWEVRVGFEVENYDSPGEEFWEVCYGGPQDSEIARLPEPVRGQILACPAAVQHLVLAGYKAQQSATQSPRVPVALWLHHRRPDYSDTYLEYSDGSYSQESQFSGNEAAIRRHFADCYPSGSLQVKRGNPHTTPRRPKVWIFRGCISGNLEEQSHLPAGTAEFQFSDGPDGRQGASNDYVDLWQGLNAYAGHEFDTADARFTPTEQGVYDRFVAARGW